MSEKCQNTPACYSRQPGCSCLTPSMLSRATPLQSCLPLCDPMDCSPPGSSVNGVLQARIWEWVALPSSRGPSQPRDHLLRWQTGSLLLVTPAQRRGSGDKGVPLSLRLPRLLPTAQGEKGRGSICSKKDISSLERLASVSQGPRVRRGAASTTLGQSRCVSSAGQ